MQLPDDPTNLTREELIELNRQADAILRKEADDYLINAVFSKIQEEVIVNVLNRTAKIFILCGANQSGKSYLGAVILLILMTGVLPHSIKHRIDPEKFKLTRRDFLSASLDFRMSYMIAQKKILDFLPKKEFSAFNKELRQLHTRNASTTIFTSVESGEVKFQGFEFDGIWLDEEPKTPKIWDELFMRTIKRQGFMLMTFSPLLGLSWSYLELYKKASEYYMTHNAHNISEETGIVHTPEELKKLRDREIRLIKNTDEDASPQIKFFQMTSYDNSFLPDTEIIFTEQKFKDDLFQYQARVLGRFAQLIGREVFNGYKIVNYQSKVSSAPKKYEIIDGAFKESLKGRYSEYMPKKEGRIYVIGADISEGLETGDYSCIQVIDRLTYEQVGVWHGHLPPEEVAHILITLGRYYNFAKLIPERNSHGVGVVNKIRELKYPNLYYDRDLSKEVLSRQHQTGNKRFGWYTNLENKRLMIQNLSDLFSSGKLKLNDYNTLEEMRTYIYDDAGHTSARSGCHDDRVMALAIALIGFKKTPALMAGTGEVIKYENEYKEPFGM